MARYKTTQYAICSICGKELPQTSFYKDGISKRGPRYRNECKKCYKEKRAKREDEKYTETFPVKHIKEDI